MQFFQTVAPYVLVVCILSLVYSAYASRQETRKQLAKQIDDLRHRWSPIVRSPGYEDDDLNWQRIVETLEILNRDGTMHFHAGRAWQSYQCAIHLMALKGFFQLSAISKAIAETDYYLERVEEVFYRGLNETHVGTN